MNTTEYFKRTIQAYLEERAMEDELFAAKMPLFIGEVQFAQVVDLSVDLV